MVHKMASLSRSFSYRRSFNSHHRAARDSKHVNSQKFHENIKELKQLRRRVKKVMWEWMDSKSRERVDSEFRDALSSICHITSYFEEILDITSARTQRLLNEVEKCYQDDIKTIRRENENKLRGLKDRVMQLEKSLEDSQSDNKQLSDRCEGYRRQNERLQQQMIIQQNEETEKLNSLSEEIQKLKANLKENDETISSHFMFCLQYIENILLYDVLYTFLRLDIQQQSVEEENRNLKQELKKNEDNFEKSLSKLQEENKTLRNELQSLRNEQIKRDEMLAAQLQKKENVIHQIQNQKADLDKRMIERQNMQKDGINCRFLEEKENLCITIDKLQQHLAAEKHAKEDALTSN
ncbi:hypothetical protein KUTeg_024330 [Tegillarca granosa]|uniref:Uncharacterized protein n=1 Tax=Tegillarca granosa TaxID=220873 RepID=A0ABQ9DX08_TEGGR|nr:hypothetical protein KUTeg_024330 [Tegillarca granosa]